MSTGVESISPDTLQSQDIQVSSCRLPHLRPVPFILHCVCPSKSSHRTVDALALPQSNVPRLTRRTWSKKNGSVLMTAAELKRFKTLLSDPVKSDTVSGLTVQWEMNWEVSREGNRIDPRIIPQGPHQFEPVLDRFAKSGISAYMLVQMYTIILKQTHGYAIWALNLAGRGGYRLPCMSTVKDWCDANTSIPL
jgi:hypothetical protein